MDELISNNSLKEAQYLYKNRKFPEAIVIYKKFLAANSDNYNVHENLAKAYFHNGQYKESQHIFIACVENNHINYEIRRYLADISYFTDKYSEALTGYLELLAEEPEVQELLFWIGSTYNAMENSQEAITYYEMAIALDNNDKDAHEAIGLISHDTEPLKAIKHLEKAYSLKPGNIDTLELLVVIYLEQEMKEELWRTLDKLKNIDQIKYKKFSKLASILEALDEDHLDDKNKDDLKVLKDPVATPIVLSIWFTCLVIIANIATFSMVATYTNFYWGIITCVSIIAILVVIRAKTYKKVLRKVKQEGYDIADNEELFSRLKHLFKFLWCMNLKVILEVLLDLLFFIILMGSIAYVGYYFGPILGGLSFLLFLYLMLKIRGYERDDEYIIKPFSLSELFNKLKFTSVTLFRDFFILILTIFFSGLLFCALLFMLKLNIPIIIVFARIISTLLIIFLVEIAFEIHKATKKDINLDKDEKSYSETVDNIESNISRQLFSWQRNLIGILHSFLAERTIMPTIVIGLTISTFTSLTLMGGAGNLSEVNLIESFKYVIQVYLDTIFQDLFALFEISITTVEPTDLFSRIYTVLLRYIVLGSAIMYILMLRRAYADSASKPTKQQS
ncbi:MAG: tetratricopeptide repeat protein [candidate division Zixibacteria bacterium]|nr:tetratricopeptide repeat protein [candidate division Zixibacteria bacterium]